MTQALAGRAAEIGILDGLLADRTAEPRAVLVEGPPGIGKTTLLRALLERADEVGYAVTTCRPSRSEAERSSAGLVGVLEASAATPSRRSPAPRHPGC